MSYIFYRYIKIPQILLSVIFLLWCSCAHAMINIVAAENMYGSVAQQLGGHYVHVISILNNPNQDPHLFSASFSTARAVANADIIVYNDAAYDDWMEKLLSVSINQKRTVINIAQLLNKKPGDNPHLWYDPATMPIYAQRLVQSLIQQDPEHQAYYSLNLLKFNSEYQQLNDKINQLRQQFNQTPVIATEPLFGYMAQALGMQMYGTALQISVMNDVEPSPSQLQQFETALRQHTVKILFYNVQVTNPLTQRLQSIAQAEGIPIVGISETQPDNMTYIQWMLKQLSTTELALHSESH